MDLKFQQSEPIAARRRWILVLVQDADATAALTGATGQVYISKNGATGVLSTNSIVEIDSVNMPGQYYIELTAGELSDLGWISIYKKTASSKAFEDRGFVSYDDPAARHGGFAQNFGSGGKGGGLSKTQAKALLDDIRAIVQEEFAKDEVEDDQEQVQEQKDYDAKLDLILEAVTQEESIPEPVDLSPVLDAIRAIPQGKDYTSVLNGLTAMLKESKQMDMTSMNEMMATCQQLMVSMSASIEGSMKSTETLASKFEELQVAMETYRTTLAEQSDMDKRFDAMTAASNNKVLADLAAKVKTLALQIIDLNYNLKKSK